MDGQKGSRWRPVAGYKWPQWSWVDFTCNASMKEACSKAINASHVSSLSMCSLNLKSPLPFSCSSITSSWINLNPYGKPKMKASLSVMLCTFTVWLCMRPALPCPSLTDLFFQGIFFSFSPLSELLLLIMCNWGKSEKQGQLLLISTGKMKRVHPGTQRGGQLKSDHGGFLASGSRHF